MKLAIEGTVDGGVNVIVVDQPPGQPARASDIVVILAKAIQVAANHQAPKVALATQLPKGI